MPEDLETPKDLKSLLLCEIESLRNKSDEHKHLFRRIQYSIITLTAASAVVSGLVLLKPDGVEARTLQFVVLAITTLVTAVTAYGELRRSRELWQHEREVFYALKDLHRESVFFESLGELTVEKQHEIFGRAQFVLGSSTNQWVGIYARKNPNAAGDGKANPAT